MSLVFLFFGLSSVAQNTQEFTLEVAGVCEMCEARIEKAVDVPGVRFADYDLESHTLTVVLKTSKVSIEELGELLNEAGHDNSISKATDEEYDRIHHCCKYREHEH